MCILTQSIKTPLVFKRFTEEKYMPISCGYCHECRDAKIQQWQIRWKEHLKNENPENIYFLTLTYSDENLPKRNIEDIKFQTEDPDIQEYSQKFQFSGEVSTLNPEDVTKFLKRLRKAQDKYNLKNGLPKSKISYHYCGEYGNNSTKRPHYHMLICGVTLPISYESNDFNNTFANIWKNGTVKVKRPTNGIDGIVKYVLKYMDKNDTSIYNIKDYLFEKKLRKAQRVYEIDIITANYLPSLSFPYFPYFTPPEDKLTIDWNEEECYAYKYHNESNLQRAFAFQDYLIDNKSRYNSIFSNNYIKYTQKIQLRLTDRFIFRTKNFGRYPEFTRCSKNIGIDYLTEENIKMHHDNPEAQYSWIDKKGHKTLPLPRYYSQRIFNPPLEENGKYKYDKSELRPKLLRKYQFSNEDDILNPEYLKSPLYKRHYYYYLKLSEPLDDTKEQSRKELSIKRHKEYTLKNTAHLKRKGKLAENYA